MNLLRQISGNYVLNVVFLCWLSAQLLKTLFYYIKTGKFNRERLWGAGGMPSAHSATVCGLAVAVARVDGARSPVFAACIVLATIVMYDAMGVRRAAGEQAKLINRIVGLHDEDDETEDPIVVDKPLKEYIGHTPLEVLAGALLGILMAMIIPNLG